MTDRTHELSGFTEAYNDDKYIGPEHPAITDTGLLVGELRRWFGLIMDENQLQRALNFMDAVKQPKYRFPRDPHKHPRTERDFDEIFNWGEFPPQWQGR